LPKIKFLKSDISWVIIKSIIIFPSAVVLALHLILIQLLNETEDTVPPPAAKAVVYETSYPYEISAVSQSIVTICCLESILGLFILCNADNLTSSKFCNPPKTKPIANPHGNVAELKGKSTAYLPPLITLTDPPPRFFVLLLSILLAIPPH